MDGQLFSSIIGLIVTLAGIIKVLIDRYFKKAEELEKHKANYTEKQIMGLKEIVEKLEKSMSQFEKKMDSHTEKVRHIDMRMESFISMLKTYVESNHKTTEKMKSDIIKISDDIIMLKSKKGV